MLHQTFASAELSKPLIWHFELAFCISQGRTLKLTNRCPRNDFQGQYVSLINHFSIRWRKKHVQCSRRELRLLSVCRDFLREIMSLPDFYFLLAERMTTKISHFD